MNISKSARKNDIANYALAVSKIANDALIASRQVSGFTNAIETNQDRLKDEKDAQKKRELQDEITFYERKVKEEREKLEKTKKEEEKRITPFLKAIAPLYAKFEKMHAVKDHGEYKATLEKWLRDNAIEYNAEDVFVLMSAVGLKKSSNKKLFEEGKFTQLPSEKAFTGIMAGAFIDLAGDQIPKFNWTYKAPKKVK